MVKKNSLLLSVCKFSQGIATEQGAIKNAENLQKVVSSKFTARRSVGKTDRKFITDSFIVSMFLIGFAALVLYYISTGLLIYFSNNSSYDQSLHHLQLSTQTTVSSIVNQLKSILDEGHTFLDSAANFLDSALLSGAFEPYDLVTIMQQAIRASSSNILSFELGFNDGVDSYYVYSGYPRDNLEDNIYFTSSTFSPTYTLYRWETGKETINDDFKTLTNGIATTTNIQITQTYTFQFARNHTGQVIYGYPIFGWFENMERPAIKLSYANEVTGFLALPFVMNVNVDLSTPYDYLQSYADFYPRSKYAITTEDGTLIALSDDISIIDYFDNEITTKTISTLNDPLWLQLCLDDRFNDRENFSALIYISGEYREFSVTITPVSLENYYTFYVYSVICISDIAEQPSDITSEQILTFFLAVLILVLVFIAAIIVSKKFLKFNIQSKFGSRSRARKSHIQKRTLNSALKDMYTLIQKTKNPQISKELYSIIDDINSAGDRAFTTVNDLPKSELFSNEIYSTFKKLFSEKKLPGRIEYPIHEHNKEHQSFKQRKLTKQLTKEEACDIIYSCFRKCSNIFDQTDFKAYLDDSIVYIENQADDELVYFADSLSFIKILLDKKIRVSDNILFAIFFNLLVFHKLIANRKEKPRKTLRFFICDDEILRTAIHDEICRIYQFLLDKDDKQWPDYVCPILILSEALVLKNHLLVFSRTPLYSLQLKEYDIQTPFVSYEVAKILLITSSTSYFYHSPNQLKDSLESFIGSTSSHLANCISKEYVADGRNALTDLFGPHFVKRLCSS